MQLKQMDRKTYSWKSLCKSFLDFTDLLWYVYQIGVSEVFAKINVWMHQTVLE